ncbi:sensor histidine kinase [Alistipes sp. ZOR0009]|uniref:sensor histidine kinase n=1 Tax=Alistipes sp. ZOR0009 TaxID=1339253 RepID=UPI000645CB49|nr:sensor histidine kinase [Alistipes sp. ZOR0009]
MSSQNDTFLSDKGRRIIVVLLAFILLNLMSFLIDPYDKYWTTFFTKDQSIKIFDIISSLIFCILISESSVMISHKLNKRVPWTAHSGKRLALEITLNLLSVSLIVLISNYAWMLCYEAMGYSDIRNPISVEEIKGIIQWLMISFFIAFMIIGVNIGDYLIVSWKNTLLKAEKLDRALIESELQALKLQIDPHFMFNNLSVLSELILQDQQLGYTYAENFSKIYRYMLVNSRKDFIELKDELTFLKSYMFLIKQRIGDGVMFDIKIDAAAQELLILPLTLQLLVENAIKHNKTQKETPLKISIYNRGKKELAIQNTLLPIENVIDSMGIGLSNIVRRYSFLSNSQPTASKEDGMFIVRIPLISIANDR